MQEIWDTKTLRKGPLELVLLPGLGGRLWDIRYDAVSLVFNNPDIAGRDVDLAQLNQLPSRSPQFCFPLWGGEKTWVAPDRNWPQGAPHKALDSGPYSYRALSENSVEMRSAICPDSHLQITRQVSLIDEASWTLRHQITNRGARASFAGIWAVLMLNHPTNIGLMAASDRPATSIFGKADGMIEKTGTFLTAKCTRRQEFKIGDDNPNGRVFLNYTAPNAAIWLCVETPSPLSDTDFAHQHNFEIFNSGDYDYCEAEWHSPAQELEPGEMIGFEQRFNIGNQDDLFPDLELTKNEMELIRCMS